MSSAMHVHVRFWKSMGERFGNRWFEVHGPKPTKAWCELLDEFAKDIDGALLRLKDRPERERAHPPTHAEFQVLLVAAAKARNALSNADQLRAYWRSVVVGGCMSDAVLLNLVPYGERKLEALPREVYPIALQACNELVSWACDEETRRGQRTPEIGQHVSRSIWNLLKPWARKGEFDTSHLRTSSVPRGTVQNTK